MVWQSLQLSQSAATYLTPLLISTTFSKDEYTLYLTDLTHIWSESLDRRGIIRRSREEGTSIDPSDEDQFLIFLDKIKSGLEGAENTTLALTINAEPAARPSLVLNVSIDLPGGFSPLRWPMRLAASSHAQFTSQLTLPLLRAQHVHMQEMAGMAEAVREKDHIIQRLLDQLESQGIDLGEIFPQAGRSVDRKKAGDRVRGLGTFDADAWRKNLQVDVPQQTAQLIGTLFKDGTSSGVLLDAQTAGMTSSEDSWWESIRGATLDLSSGRISTNGLDTSSKSATKPIPAIKRNESSGDDGAFQVQELPLHRFVAKSTSKDLADNTTDDEDDDIDAPSQRTKTLEKSPTPPLAPSPKRKKAMGKIEDKRTVSKVPPPEEDGSSTEDDGEILSQIVPKSASSAQRKAAVDMDDESTEDEGSPAKRVSPKKEVPGPELEKSKPRKLGKIGGKKEALPPDTEPEPEHEPPIPSSPKLQEPKEKKGKLGKIGGKKKAAEPEAGPNASEVLDQDPETSPSTSKNNKLDHIDYNKHESSVEKKSDAAMKAEDDSQERGRVASKPIKEKTPEPRETSTERADRRRLQLKREVEAKAKAPVKKKRKF